MTTRALDLKQGDIVLVNNTIIGCIRYIGFVNGLSNGRSDEYIGIEIKIKNSSQNDNDEDIRRTNGSYNGYIYWSTGQQKQDGRFVKRAKITKKYTSEELFDCIKDKKSLIPSVIDPVM